MYVWPMKLFSMWESEKAWVRCSLQKLDKALYFWLNWSSLCIFSAWHQQHPLKLRCNSIVILTDIHGLSCSRQVCSSYDPHRTFTATDLTEATSEFELYVFLFSLCVSDYVCICAWMLYAMYFGLCKCFFFRKMSLHLCLCLWIWYKKIEKYSPCFKRFFLCFLPLWWRFALKPLICPLCFYFISYLEVILPCRL